ncbi:hypothetical protein AVEN_142903-1 [Araneus ventricosus]|uniref:Reverse transcriptase zinc-binding domain-containing protein n=1 Tax=Araneus ventricosus TaxID=182803 RepID=A0A4Y2FMW6_ARAVE|nr:hypothetical protein AVEN_142903-1 [Araneus ventricosus]
MHEPKHDILCTASLLPIFSHALVSLQNRANLSPFTKDYRGEEQLNEPTPIFIGLWPILPIRQVDVTLTRLHIGHTRFTHKHLIFGEMAPECPSCHQNFTVHHILIECPSFKSHSVHHFHSSSVTLQDLVGEKHHPNIFNFLKAIGFYACI